MTNPIIVNEIIFSVSWSYSENVIPFINTRVLYVSDRQTLHTIGMDECLTTPQHKNQIGYCVSEKGKGMKWLYN